MDRRVRILAVDDEPRAVGLVKRVLSDRADVETATSGAEAWRLFEAGSFDLVISDQRMPGMTGIELLAKVAERAPATGRILLTGYADSVDTLDAVNRAQVHAYLGKPCPPTQLTLAVGSVLERIEMERDRTQRADAEPDVADLGALLSECEQLREALDAPAGEALADPRARRARELAERITERVEALASKQVER